MRDQPVPVKHAYACDYDEHAAYWLTRLCLYHDAYLNLMITGDIAEEIRQFMGVCAPVRKLQRETLRTKLKVRLKAFNLKPVQGCSEVFVNSRMLAQLLQLNEVEQRIMEFAALSYEHRALRLMIEGVGYQRTEDLLAMIAAALDASPHLVRGALDRKATLMQTTLLYYERSGYDMSIKLYTSERLSQILHIAHKETCDLVEQFVEPVDEASLTVKDYPHLAKEIELLGQYLSSALQSQSAGVNILIYGQPGVGKTELARLLAKRVRKSLFEVKSSEDGGGAMSGAARLMSFSLSQRILHRTDALILFDEMEDMFSEVTSVVDRLRHGRVNKAWINDMLESNPVPTIWVSNEVASIDSAYLRRFDMSLEIGVPPVPVRKRIIKKHLHGLRLSPAALEKYAQHDELTPSQIEKAAKVSLMIAEQGGDWRATFEQVLSNSMTLLQQSPVSAKLDLSGAHYRLDYLNADGDLSRLVEQLSQAKNPRGAICFYGAPGTGKSALAHYISQTSERPLLVRRASDILSPYVGVAEQKIAQMFKQAEQEQSILLLDEADSFLADRKGAKASWEVTQVNELLTQMESFQGLFICSTNLMTRLDEASLRRFALKIRFDYLKPEQRWRLYSEHIGQRVRVDEAHCRAKLNQMNNLTPGDFACIRRQSELLNEKLSAEKWLFHLERECRAKPDQGGRAIGFM